ncbi:MAG: hypothetical protein OIF38_18375 [Cellvibrionaceae bacterium]|nr:hypothetical protein [Cellvibrionaceae bacterium]
MEINSGSSLAIGVQGLHKGKQTMQGAASEIAGLGNVGGTGGSQPQQSNGASLIEPIAALKQGQQLFDASAKVVEVSGRTLGSLLDIKA